MALVTTPQKSPGRHTMDSICLDQLDSLCSLDSSIGGHSNVHLVPRAGLDFLDLDLPDVPAVIVKIVPLHEGDVEYNITGLFHAAGLGPKSFACVTDPELGVHYMILELLEGPTLAEHIAQGNPVPSVALVSLFRRIATCGFHHRDLNLGNIIVTPTNGPMVIDFADVNIIGMGPVYAAEHKASFMHMCRDVSDRIRMLRTQLDQVKEEK